MRATIDVTTPIVFVLLGVAAVCSTAVTVHVDVAGGGDFATIQEGLDAASEGDTVLVAAGSYVGPLNRDLDPGEKNLVIMSAAGASLTIINCDHMGRGFYVHGGQDGRTIIAGFTVTGGSISGCGAGVCCETGSSPEIRECQLIGNAALGEWPDGLGGGLYLGEGCDATVSDCILNENSATFGGGGLVLSASPAIVGCEFRDNTTALGGGGAASVSAYPSFVDCVMAGNSATFGGGVACDGGVPTFADCLFSLNQVQYHGGGMSAHVSAAGLERCTFEGNTAGGHGGALLSEGSPFTSGVRGDPAPALLGCALIGNSASEGGGVYATFGAAPELSGCTLYANSGWQGGGIFCWQTSAAVADCILASSVEGAGIHCGDGSSTPFLRRCVIFDNEGGDAPCGDFDDILFVDPLFCDATGGELGLCADSPCLPAGNPWGALIGAFGEACGPCATAVQMTTWGSVKAMFRDVGD